MNHANKNQTAKIWLMYFSSHRRAFTYRRFMASLILVAMILGYENASSEEPITPEQVGRHQFDIKKGHQSTFGFEETEKIYGFDWYRVTVDHNQRVENKVWDRIKFPKGTVAAYAARYTTIEFGYADNFDETYIAKGIDFLYQGDIVQKDSSPVRIRRLFYEEPNLNAAIGFHRGQLHIICLDRKPISTFKIQDRPYCDLDTELSHVIAVIEVNETYDWKSLKARPPFDFDLDCLVSFSRKRHGISGGAYNLEYAIRRDEKNKLVVVNRDGAARAPRELLDKFMYSIRSSRWVEQKSKPNIPANPLVKTEFVYLDEHRRKHTIVLRFHDRSTNVEVDGRYYRVAFPNLLHNVFWMIDQLCIVRAPPTR